MYIENTQQLVAGLFMMGFASGCFVTWMWVLFCRAAADKMVRGKGEPEPRKPQPPSYKLMPDGHTLYGPEPKTPPPPPPGATITPTTAKGNYPKEKPEGSTGSIRIE